MTQARAPLFAGAYDAILPALVLVLGLAVCLSGSAPVERARNLVFDEYQRFTPRPWRDDLPVRVVDIDDASLARYGQWPWPRDRLAEISDALAANGAGAIAFDILFAEADRAAPQTVLRSLPQTPERDALLATLTPEDSGSRFTRALNASPSVTAFVLNHDNANAKMPLKAGFAVIGDDPRGLVPSFSGAVPPLPAIASATRGLGAINFAPDRDLVVRRVPLVASLGQGADAALVPSLDLEILRVAQDTSTIEVKGSNASDTSALGTRSGIVAIRVGAVTAFTERDGALRVRYAGTQDKRRISVANLLDGKVPRSEIEGRLMIIGTSAAALADLRSTPLEGAVPGVDIHAEALEHLLSGAKLARPDYAPGLEALLVLAGSLLLFGIARLLEPLPASLLAAALIGGLVTASILAFRNADLLIDPLLPGMTWLGVFALTTVARFRRSDRERRSVRRAFARYLSPTVVERLADDPTQLELGGQSREMTILFCDARDFTTRSETMSASGVVNFLNALLTPLTNAVLEQSGTIDKYLGDGLMAFWNAPLDQTDHATRACRAALSMMAQLPGVDSALRASAREEGRPYPPLTIGIGINTGPAFVGNMGSQHRFDYSAVGDTVNIAARLESASKECGVGIIVSRTTAQAAQGFLFVALGRLDLKGKSGGVRAFALHGTLADRTPAFDEFQRLHDAALAAVEAKAQDAQQKIAQARAHSLGGIYATFYARLSS